MSKRLKAYFVILCTGLAIIAQTPVQKYGQLKIEGNKILDKNDNPVQLRGMSMYWSQARESENFYNANAVKWLVDDWKITVIRAALGAAETWEGSVEPYTVDPEGNKNRVKAVVDAAIANGIYVIIDWHDHQANLRTSSAKAFFEEMA